MENEALESLLIERPDRLRLCRFSELVRRIPASWQVRNVLREDSIILLYGKRGGYKSFLALDIAASIASNIAWHGNDIVEPGLVIYVAAEGGGGMVQRARAWVEHHDRESYHVNLMFVTEPVIVTASSEDMEILVHRIREAIQWVPIGHFDTETGHEYEQEGAREWPKLIVIDTLARCFVGNENQQEDMGEFIQGVDRLKREFGCSVLIVHHTGKDGKQERGSTVLGGACDTIYKVEADTESQQLVLLNEKMKDGREPMPMQLSYREVKVRRREGDDPNEELTSVVISSGYEKKARAFLTQRELLVTSGSLSWGEWADLAKEVLGISKTAFNRNLNRLRETKQIIKKNGLYEAL